MNTKFENNCWSDHFTKYKSYSSPDLRNDDGFLSSCIGDLSRFRPCGLLLTNTFKLFGFPIFRCWAYLMKVVVNTSRSFPRSWLITGFVTRLTRRVSLVEQELLTLSEHLSLPPVFSGVRVIWSLVLYVCFGNRCLSFCTFSFGHGVVCSSSIYGFWLPLWYLQLFLF